MRTSGQRSDQYAAKYVATTVGLKVASGLGSMKTGFAAATGQLVAIELKIQGILNAIGVAVVQYPFYLNFGREMWSLTRQGLNGPALVSRATGLHDKYVSYGLTTANVKRIALDVFNVTIP